MHYPQKDFNADVIAKESWLRLLTLHNADSDPSKTLGTQCHAKFLFCDDQSTHLTILVKKLDAPFCSK